MHVVFMRLSIRGFIVTDFLAKAQETLQLFVKSFQEGKLKIGAEQEHVVDTKFDEIPKTWMQLFEGGNRGKLVTKIV
jgi:NADPH-dependent curcumin reductase CurA